MGIFSSKLPAFLCFYCSKNIPIVSFQAGRRERIGKEATVLSYRNQITKILKFTLNHPFAKMQCINCHYQCSCLEKETIFDLKSFMSQMSSIPILSKKCKKHKYNATKYCSECNLWVCNYCLENHSTHFLLDYELKIQCSEHKKKYLAYCSVCKLNLCVICKRNHSKEHELIIVKPIQLPNYEAAITQIDEFINNIKDMPGEYEEINKPNSIIEHLHKESYSINIKLKEIFILFFRTLSLLHDYPSYQLMKLNQAIQINTIINDKYYLAGKFKLGNYFQSNFIIHLDSFYYFHRLEGNQNISIYGDVSDIHFKEDLFCQKRNKEIQIKNSNYKTLETLVGYQSEIKILILLNNGLLLSASSSEIKIWNLNQFPCQCFTTFYITIKIIIQLTEGPLVVALEKDPIIQIWDNATLKCIQTINCYNKSANAIIESDKKQIACCSQSKDIELWNSESFVYIGTLRGHNERINSLVKLKEGELASSSCDGIIMIWNTRSMILLSTMETFLRTVIRNYPLKLLQNGLLCFSSENEIQLWDIPSLKCVSIFFSAIQLIESNNNELVAITKYFSTIWKPISLIK